MAFEDPCEGWDGAAVPTGIEVGVDVWIPEECCPEGMEDGTEGVLVGVPMAATFVAAVEGPDPLGADMMDK